MAQHEIEDTAGPAGPPRSHYKPVPVRRRRRAARQAAPAWRAPAPRRRRPDVPPQARAGRNGGSSPRAHPIHAADDPRRLAARRRGARLSDFLTAIGPGALVTLAAIAASVAAVLILFVGFCVVFNLPKLRSSGRDSMVVRSLDEMSGTRQDYLPV